MNYVHIENQQLLYRCRKCGHQEAATSSTASCLYEKKKSAGDEEKFRYFVNPYTKFDPTLPHVHNVDCPNDTCTSRQPDQTKDVVYLRYDNKNMKYVYICVVCDAVWKSSLST